jgi:hypothetical protein
MACATTNDAGKQPREAVEPSERYATAPHPAPCMFLGVGQEDGVASAKEVPTRHRTLVGRHGGLAS